MRLLRVCFGIAVVVVVTACDLPRRGSVTAPPLTAFTIGVPDPSFRLNAEERALVLAIFDADALETLLAMVPPDVRPTLLSRFQQSRDGERPRLVMALGHPGLQAQLEKVWAPYWSDYTDQQIDNEVAYIPGRAIARALRRKGQPLAPR